MPTRRTIDSISRLASRTQPWLAAEPSSNLGVTSVYLQGINNTEIIDTVHARRAPMIPVSPSLRL